MQIQPAELLNPIQRITAVPLEMIDQHYGGFDVHDGKACCVGAHIANILAVNVVGQPDAWDYMRGIDKWISLVGGNRAHAILMLRKAGAGKNPLSGDKWKITPTQVWKNLWKQEQLPRLASADLRLETFDGADMRNLPLRDTDSEAYSYRSTNFSYSSCYGADFSGANLAGANLNNANLGRTNFEGADLRHALLEDTDLTYTNFKNADLEGAQISPRVINKPNFKDANLKRAIVSNEMMDYIVAHRREILE